MKKKLSDEALANGKERASKVNPVRSDGLPMTWKDIRSFEHGFAAEYQRALDEGYTMATNFEDKCYKVDYVDDDENLRQHKSVSSRNYGVCITGPSNIDELDKFIHDDVLFDVSCSNGVDYEPLFEGIPGRVLKDIVRKSTEPHFDNRGNGDYVVIKGRDIPKQYRYVR